MTEVPRVRYFAQKERRPAGVGRQSMELLVGLQEDHSISVIPEMRRRGFELRIGRRRFGGYLSLLAAQSIPYRRTNGEITHAADWGIAPYFGDHFDILSFYDPFWWQNLDVYQASYPEAVRISLYVPRILRARTIVTATEYVRQRVRHLFNHDAHVIPCGLNLRDFFPRDIPKERSVLTVGADYPRKNLQLIIRACALAKYDLVTVGAWNYPGAEGRAKSLAKSMGVLLIDRGYIPDDELARLYSSCVFVTASMDEGFGLTPLEAMACGGRIVASDIPPHRENLALHATYFKMGNARDLADAIMEAADEDSKAERLAKVANAQRFSWDHIVPKWVTLYRSVWETRET